MHRRTSAETAGCCEPMDCRLGTNTRAADSNPLKARNGSDVGNGGVRHEGIHHRAPIIDRIGAPLNISAKLCDAIGVTSLSRTRKEDARTDIPALAIADGPYRPSKPTLHQGGYSISLDLGANYRNMEDVPDFSAQGTNGVKLGPCGRRIWSEAAQEDVRQNDPFFWCMRVPAADVGASGGPARDGSLRKRIRRLLYRG